MIQHDAVALTRGAEVDRAPKERHRAERPDAAGVGLRRVFEHALLVAEPSEGIDDAPGIREQPGGLLEQRLCGGQIPLAVEQGVAQVVGGPAVIGIELERQPVEVFRGGRAIV